MVSAHSVTANTAALTEGAMNKTRACTFQLSWKDSGDHCYSLCALYISLTVRPRLEIGKINCIESTERQEYLADFAS